MEVSLLFYASQKNRSLTVR